MADLPLFRSVQLLMPGVLKESAEVEHVEIAGIRQPQTPRSAVLSRPDGLQEPSDMSYPILPRKTLQKDLPFIKPTEIASRDGQDSNRLCTYLATYRVIVLILPCAHVLVGIVVDGIVLDCTQYRSKHPGGRMIIQGFGGQDASWQWWSFHGQEIWKRVALGLRVGRTQGIENRHVKPPSFVGLRSFGYQDA